MKANNSSNFIPTINQQGKNRTSHRLCTHWEAVRRIICSNWEDLDQAIVILYMLSEMMVADIDMFCAWSELW